MKVAIVHDFLQTMGGAERVTLELSKIYPQAPIFTLTYNPKLANYFSPDRIKTSYLQKLSWLPSHWLFPLYPRAIESFNFDDFDIVISSSNSYAKNIITKPGTHHLSYVHSPMRPLWDTWHTYLQDRTGNPIVQWVVRGILHRMRIWDFLGSNRVDTFIANSHNVANRIKKYYRRDSEVVYPPVDVEHITPTPNHKGYFLVVSRLSRYKRIDLAIKACNELKLPLKIIGVGEELDNLKRLAGPTVELLGWQDDITKFQYLESCQALIFPGEEDLGIVPIEAMAAGKPVIAFGKGGLLETVIDGKTGIFFPHPTAESLVSALNHYLQNPDRFDYQVIANHAQTFSATNFIAKIKQLVSDAYSNGHR